VPKVVVINHLTLDGVTQAPGRPGEDDRGGFEHGGWSQPYGDPVMGAVMGERMARGAALLLGRRTYQDFAGFWPHQEDNPFSEVLDGVQKYVASTTLREPLPWRNSTLLEGDAPDAVARLKQRPGPDLDVLGSGELVGSLMRHGLVDELLLTIHPRLRDGARPHGQRGRARLPATTCTVGLGRPGVLSELPPAVQTLVDAANAHDLGAFLAGMAPDAVVDDWGREFRGAAAITAWSDREFIGVDVTLEVTEVAQEGAASVVTATVGGRGFNGPSHFTFELEGDRVTRMAIRA
jgi:dihydrofolate reductase